MSSSQPSSCAQLPLCRQGICLCHEETRLVQFPSAKGSPFYHHQSGTDYIADSPAVVEEKEKAWNRQVMATAHQHQIEHVVAKTMYSMYKSLEETIQQETDAASSTLMGLKNPN